jgi:hypothetical protein
MYVYNTPQHSKISKENITNFTEGNVEKFKDIEGAGPLCLCF